MTFSDKTLTLLVLLSLGLSGLAIFILAVATPRGRLRQAASPEKATLSALRKHGEAIAQLQEAVGRLAGEDRRLGGLLRGAIQRVGLVRYDAFEDMGGRLSFSGALLNADGDGIVVTSINGRSDTRVYAKPVNRGTSHNLSEEESEAIHLAMGQGVPARAS
jgi:hypothetical protein